MIPFTIDLSAVATAPACDEPHVLVVVGDAGARYRLAHALLEAGFRVSLAGSYGLVDILLRQTADFDLLVTVQSLDEMAQFGLPQLARSAQPDLPIVVLEPDSVSGPGVVEAIGAAIERWPLRERGERRVH